MQQALPYRTWLQTSLEKPNNPITQPISVTVNNNNREDMKNMVSENAVLIFGKRGCCMCHAMKRLLLMLGVNPGVYEVDEKDEVGVIDELVRIGGDESNKNDKLQFPFVFIGGKFFGGLDRLMAAHISGELVPKLKQAGGLWL